MATRVLLLLALALMAVQCPAQSTITPYSWTTIAPLQVDNGCGNGTGGREGFGAPTGIAADKQGNLYVADACNHIIHQVRPVGTNWVVTTLAGLAGTSGWVDGTGNVARFNHPTGVAVDGAGNLYVADRDNHSIRMVTPAGVVSTLAGHPLFGYANGPGSAALFSDPTSVAVDTAGNLYVADHNNNMIRKMTLVGTDWQVTTMAGTTNRTGPGAGQGTDPGTQLNLPVAVAVDGAGTVYVADYWSDTIRKVTPDGGVTTLAGHFVMPVFNGHYGNADGTGPEAQFNYPYGLAVDSKGNVYVADTENSEIRKVTPDGVVTTLGGVSAFNGWGNPVAAYQDGTGSTARFNEPTGVAVDSKGNLYVADLGNLKIRKGVAPVVQVVALEVTQVIQDWNNSVRLIEDKPTYVRAHVQLPPNSSGPVKVSGARLYGFRGNGPLPKSPTFPINPGGRLTVQTANAAKPNVRGHFAESLNFRLPSEWLSGTITLQLVWAGGLEPINGLSSDCTAEVTFYYAAVPQIKLLDVPWAYAGDTYPHKVGLNLLKDLKQRILSCYPVASVHATFGTLPVPFTGPPKMEAVNSALVMERYCDEVSDLFGKDPFVGKRIYHGAVPPNDRDPFLGLAVGYQTLVSSSHVPSAKYGLGRQTAAHEIGHNLGLQHDVSQALHGGTSSIPKGACNEDGWGNYAYPLFQPMAGYPNGAPTLGPMTLGDNYLVYGLDTLTLRFNPTMEPVLSCTNMAPIIYDPNCYFDLMSYCPYNPHINLPSGPEDCWPSIVTYLALIDEIKKAFGPPSPALQAVQAPKGLGGNYLIARGLVDFNAGTAQFLPCLALSTSNPPPLPLAGTNFLLQALDGSGLVLQAIEFELKPSIVERGDPSQTADFIVPLTGDPSIRTLRLWSHGVLLATLSASAHAPALTLTTPNGGQNFATGTVNVAWSGNDADKDPLTYTVQYTADDGATWETLAVDWPGQSLEIASSELAATTSGRMRVIASDGFNTAAAQSTATFTVQPHAPDVSINSPPDGAIFMAEEQLFLDASADDMQDGALDGANVQWSSNLDGPLGQGAIVTFNAKNLREGYHAITVTAINSAGLTNSAVTHLLALQYTPPELSITLTPGIEGFFPPSWTLSWPSYYTNYVLQSSASLASGWAAVSNPAPSGNQLSVDVGVGGVTSFFRLIFQP